MPLHVLLLDEGFMSGAFTAVGLRDAGCRVTIDAAVGRRAHYDAPRIAWSLGPRPRNLRYLAHVETLVRQRAPDCVLPLTEPIQALLWRAQPGWGDRIVPRPMAWQQRLLADKGRMARFLAARGVAIPPQMPVASTADLVDAIDALGMPMVMKGVRGRGGAATHIVSTIGEAEAALARVRRRGTDCLAQAFVRGRTVLAGGLFRDGQAIRLYAGEKLRQHPRRTGPATVIQSVGDGQLLKITRHIMAMLRWTGLASADFVRDDQGRYWFLELNPRPWGSIIAAAAAEADLWSPLAAMLAGAEPAPSLHYRLGVTSLVLPLALLSPSIWGSPSVLWRTMRAVPARRGHLWWPPRQGLHLAQRLLWMAREWQEQ
jgi:carbamoylphosphate synthase large subunit